MTSKAETSIGSAAIGPGFRVTPSITLTRALGAGGMGCVWLAEHAALRTSVVVKFMHDALAGLAEGRERFAREAATAALVRSPHVVQMLDHGVTDHGAPFIVMELLEGEDLRRRLHREPVLAPGTVAAVVEQVGEALTRAHRRGIVHRDITPENIFLCASDDDDDPQFFVKLLDFGIARGAPLTTPSGTLTGAALGTPRYMSPEQAIGAPIDHRTDIWSLGLVAFRALTGRDAFEGANFGALAVAMNSGSTPLPSRVNPALPPALDAWFARACAQDPNARFSDARELAVAFHAAIGAEPIIVSSSPPPATCPPVAADLVPVRPAPKRNNVALLIVAAVLLFWGGVASVCALTAGSRTRGPASANKPRVEVRRARASASTVQSAAPPASAEPAPSAGARPTLAPRPVASAKPTASTVTSAAPKASVSTSPSTKHRAPIE